MSEYADRCPKCGLGYSSIKPSGNIPYSPDNTRIMLRPCCCIIDKAELEEKHRRERRAE